MKTLGIEFIKSFKSNTFRTILILHLLLFLLLVYLASKIDISVPGFSTRNMFMFPNVWGLYAWFASWFNLLFLGIIVVVLTSNEFSFKTTRMQIVNGLSRNEFILSKLILILVIATWGMVLVFLTSLVSGFIFTSDLSFQLIFEKSYIILVYFIQAIAYMSFALFMAILFRNNALSIMMYLLYFIMIEPLFRLFFPRDIRSYFPVKVISGLTPVPDFLSQSSNSNITAISGRGQLDFESIGILPEAIPVWLSVVLAGVYTSAFIWLAWWLFRRKDL